MAAEINIRVDPADAAALTKALDDVRDALTRFLDVAYELDKAAKKSSVKPKKKGIK